MRSRAALCFLVLVVVAYSALGSYCAAAHEQQGPVSSSPREYKGREIAQTMHYLGAPWLTRESREREEDCKTLLAALKVKPGDTVCDLGCGHGFYSVTIAKLVGERGRVI